MEISVQTPALLFPAISLLMLAYTNRYLALARIVRDLTADLRESDNPALHEQIDNLALRLRLIKETQVFGLAALMTSIGAMGTTLFGENLAGTLLFGLSLLLMLLSLGICLREVLLSGNALTVVLRECGRCTGKRKV